MNYTVGAKNTSVLFSRRILILGFQGSSGIQELETDTFKLQCNQTLTGVKFIVVSDKTQQGVDQLLDKVKSFIIYFHPKYNLILDLRALCRFCFEKPLLLTGDANQRKFVRRTLNSSDRSNRTDRLYLSQFLKSRHSHSIDL